MTKGKDNEIGCDDANIVGDAKDIAKGTHGMHKGGEGRENYTKTRRENRVSYRLDILHSMLFYERVAPSAPSMKKCVSAGSAGVSYSRESPPPTPWVPALGEKRGGGVVVSNVPDD